MGDLQAGLSFDRSSVRLYAYEHAGIGLSCTSSQQVAAGTTIADVGAVLVQADALGQFRHHVLGQAGVRAGGAGLGAFEAGLDACGGFLQVDTGVAASRLVSIVLEKSRDDLEETLI